MLPKKEKPENNFAHIKIMSEWFRKFAVYVSRWVGSIWALLVFVGLLVTTGFYFKFSAAWENNVTFCISIITLAVLIFLQRSQNHNDAATHLKLDELIKASEKARNKIASVETQSEKELQELQEES